MSYLIELLERFAPWVVLANTLLHEIGVPIPLTPTLMLAGALSPEGALQPLVLIGMVILGTVVGNSIWFAAGRRWGSRVLGLMCRISLSPDTCVGKTEGTFTRWGLASLIVGRFIPGVSLIAPPVAGALGMSWRKFLVATTAGAALWALVVVGVGMLLHEQIDAAVEALDALGQRALAALLVALALYIVWRWIQRRRARRELDMPRISVAELKALLDEGKSPLVIDVRGSTARTIDPRLVPGAIALDLDHIERGMHELPRDREIVFYCSCPNEASAARAARVLIGHGHSHARPLAGGLEAWLAAGHDIDDHTAPPA